MEGKGLEFEPGTSLLFFRPFIFSSPLFFLCPPPLCLFSGLIRLFALFIHHLLLLLRVHYLFILHL